MPKARMVLKSIDSVSNNVHANLYVQIITLTDNYDKLH